MSKRFDSLEAYTPGEQPRNRKYIKLNTNESPFPPSPEVIKVINENETSALMLYPDPTTSSLKKAIAEKYDNITVVDGFKLVPHTAEYFIDNLHPNCLGSEIYGRNLVLAIEKAGF